MGAVGTIVGAEQLSQVATEITREHEAASRAAASALTHARRAGELLSEAKAKLPHGAWLPWLAECCPAISERTARAYMTVAKRWPEIQAEQDRQRAADFSLRQALALLTEPRKPAEPKTAEPAHWIEALAALRVSIEKQVDSWPADMRALAPGALEDAAAILRHEQSPERPVLEVPAGAAVGEATCRGEQWTVFVTPHTDPTYTFVTVMIASDTDPGASLEGTKRGIRRSEVGRLLEHMRVPVEALKWTPVQSQTPQDEAICGPWTYNQLLYGSHAEYVQRAILGTG